jgi:CubicO group peptidase (beta-lactamase class C family)
MLSLTGCHVGRFFIWNFADTGDKDKFSYESIETSLPPFKFVETPLDTPRLRVPKTLTISGERVSFEKALEDNKTTAFLIIRKDTILYEKYFGDYQHSTLHTSFSVAKSFVSALVGIAIAEGKIKSVQEPITNYLEFENEGFNKITIEHLLDMRSGIEFNEGYYNPFGHVAKYYYGKSLRNYVKDLKVESAPGKSFNYISVNTQLLAFIVEKATGKPINEYLTEKIWKPLHMEYSATWSIDSEKDAAIKAFCCLNATARDFAKFGRLYLNNGNWNGQQIVPIDWVEKSTTFTTAKNNFQYSYQWWHLREYDKVTDSTDFSVLHTTFNYTQDDEEITVITRPKPAYFAQGILGQYIYVHPKKDIIIVRLGHKPGKELGGSWASICDNIAALYP